MWNRPSEKQLAKIPALYSTEKIPLKDKIICSHFFTSNTDWWVVEYGDGLFFCYTNLGYGEWGYTSLEDLIRYRSKFGEVDRDLHWKPCKASEIKEIRC